MASVALYGPHSRFTSRADLANHLNSVRECAAAIHDALTDRLKRGPAKATPAPVVAPDRRAEDHRCARPARVAGNTNALIAFARRLLLEEPPR
jgi:hypothetical protein